MANETYQVNNINGSYVMSAVSASPGATLSQNTISLAPGTATVTITPGTSGSSSLTFTNSVVMPSVFSGNGINVSPMAVSLTSGQFVYTCTNALTSGQTSVSGSFFVTIQSGSSFVRHDPTMVFNPPQ